eukprot:9725-Heterococcus_DN1.PRE.4
MPELPVSAKQAITQTLLGMMPQHSIKLIVVHSRLAAVRTDLSSKRADLALRSRMLCEMAQAMKRLSDVHDAAAFVV